MDFWTCDTYAWPVQLLGICCSCFKQNNDTPFFVCQKMLRFSFLRKRNERNKFIRKRDFPFILCTCFWIQHLIYPVQWPSKVIRFFGKHSTIRSKIIQAHTNLCMCDYYLHVVMLFFLTFFIFVFLLYKYKYTF